jgi:oligopeptide transport system substrate-binding protein
MRRFMAALLALAVLAAVGCSKKTADNTGTDNTKTPDTKKEQVIKVNIGTDPQTLNPLVSTGVPEANVETQLFAGLMRLNKDGKSEPDLAAAAPTVSADGLTYTFKLRDGIKWSNGDPITADDFVWSWKKALDPRTASEYAYQLYYVKGGEKLNTIPMNQVGADGKEVKGADGKAVPRPDKDIAADVEKAAAEVGVKALDAKTLEVKLEAPTPYFDKLVAFHTLYPVHRKSYEAAPDDWFRKNDMVTSGPFKMVSWTPKDKIVLEKNPNFWDAANVKLDKVEYYLIDQESTSTTMYESGQLDIIESGVSNTELDRLKKEKPDELKILPDLGTYYYRFNVTKAPMNNADVRKALTLAIDRKLIVENITKAGQIPATAFVPGGLADVTGDYRKNGGDFYKDNDVATAKQLLAKAGYPDGKGFPKLTIMYNTSEAHKTIAQAIQEMWKKNLGIDVELDQAEWQVYLDRQSKLDYQVSRAGWIGDYADPMTFMDMFVTGGGNNQTGWSNKDYDAAIALAKSSGDQKVRMENMHKAEKILMDEMPVMPIYFYVRVRLVSTRVQDWSEPLTYSMDLRHAYIK